MSADMPCQYVMAVTGAPCGESEAAMIHRAGWLGARYDRPVHDYAATDRRERDRRDSSAAPDILDGAAAEYRECLEVRRLLGYLWTAEGKIDGRPVSGMFDDDDPLVADVERLAIPPDTAPAGPSR